MTIKPVKEWESEGKSANGEPFLSIYHLGGYYYSQRAGTHSVAFVLYDPIAEQIGLLNAHHGPTPSMRH